MLKARDTVVRLKEYHPPLGGRVGMRLDFNENTAGCSPRVLAKLRALTPDDLARYPEREPAERIAADYLGLAPDQVLLTNGVDEAIHLLCETYIESGDEALIATPTFSMYEIYAAAAGASIVTVQSDETLAFPAERLLCAITPRTRLIAVANPNNPTGAVADEATLLRIAAAAPQAALLVDEAYFDFYGRTLMPRIGELPNLFVARTFSKAYGMAGLRCGVLVGEREQMRMVRRVSSPYNVNAAALACLPDALADREYIAAYAAQVRRGRERVVRELAALGVRQWPTEANFILFYIGERRLAFVEAMRRRGILVRDRNGDPGCAGCVRITIGTDQQTDAAITALREVFAEIGIRAVAPPSSAAGPLTRKEEVGA
ncbi:MAG: histidinol-phosphate transaminase [Terriglobales bacterium]